MATSATIEATTANLTIGTEVATSTIVTEGAIGTTETFVLTHSILLIGRRLIIRPTRFTVKPGTVDTFLAVDAGVAILTVIATGTLRTGDTIVTDGTGDTVVTAATVVTASTFIALGTIDTEVTIITEVTLVTFVAGGAIITIDTLGITGIHGTTLIIGT
jgi:hypothetical protein